MFTEPSFPSLAPAGRAESAAEWLSRSTTDLAASARSLLNRWAPLPGAADRDVLARLRQPDDGRFSAAFLELYLFAAFARAGWPCERLTDEGKAPDFRVVSPQGPMYVEATTAGPPRRHVDAERRKGLLLDAVDALRCEYFSLGVAVVAIGPKALAPGRVRRELAAWLTGLDPDMVAANVAAAPPDADSDEEAGYPVLVTVRDGWDIEWTAYPLPAEWRGREGRLIDSESMPEAVAVEDEKPLRGSLQRKASRYGRLDGPYIVAVGEEPFSPEAGRPLRLPDGSWRRGRCWRHTRVSEVLFLAGLRPWNAKDSVPELWLNPAAALPVPARLPYWRVQRVEESAGQGRLRTEPPAVTPAPFWADSLGNSD